VLQLPNTGGGDIFMTPEFRRTLIGSQYYDPLAQRPGFFSTMAYARCLAL
jgi:hypothetical protein